VSIRKQITISMIVTIVMGIAHLAGSQQSKVYLVGILSLGSPDIPEIKGLRDGLKEAGYVGGKTLILNIAAKQSYDELRPIAKAYVEKKFDIIVGIAASAPLIAKEATQEIPIVFVGAADPIQAGLVKSTARPHSNVTDAAGKKPQARQIPCFSAWLD
jgi:putative tryptophan/tyrosine transport system substrate-binding protein